MTAAEMNSNIRDPGNFWLTKPYCNVYNNTGVPVTSGVNTLIPFDAEAEDNDGMHSTVTNPSRIIFQTTGVYLLLVAIGWQTNATGARYAAIRLNAAGSATGGTQLVSFVATAPGTTSSQGLPHMAYFYRAANVGDYIEIFGSQDSGSPITTSTGIYTRCQVMWQNA